MTRISIFLNLVRLNFLPASVFPFILGAALAYNRGYPVTSLNFFLALIGVASAHLASNAVNNYSDHASGADGPDTVTTPFFGGTKVLIEGKVSPIVCRAWAIFFGLAAVFAGAVLFFITKYPILIFMTFFGALLGAQYSAGPLRFSYRGMGEAVIFILFGPLLVMGSYYLFSGHFSLESFLLSLIPGTLIFSVIVFNEIPDVVTDRKAGKNNLVVMMGKGKGRLLCLTGVCLSSFFLAWGVLSKALPLLAGFALIFYLMAIFALKILFTSQDDVLEMTKGGMLLVMTHSLVTISIAAALIYCRMR